jgi:hypothetical protein
MMKQNNKSNLPYLLAVLVLASTGCRNKEETDTAGFDTGGWLLTGECYTPTAGSVEINSFCTYTPPSGSFDFETEWSMATFANFPSHKKSYASPMVGQLTDDNLDGLIDEYDTPDIVAVFDSRADWRGVLRVISGDGKQTFVDTHGAVLNGWTWYPYRYATPAIGDIDGDSKGEIALTVTDDINCYPAMYDRHGQLLWVYANEPLECRSHSPALADMNGDGDPEVIFGHLILDAATGGLIARGEGGRGYHDDYFNSGYQSVPVDFNGDGQQVVVAGSDIYDYSGQTICSTGYPDGYPAIADLDGDGEGEFVVTGNEYVRLFEADCSLIAEWETEGYGAGGPSTIADFDGDGEPEITVADKSRFSLYEVDGTLIWSIETTEKSSGATASSVFDFDGDGAAEVVYADEVALWVLDGQTGAVMLEDNSHTSGTVHEYPIIVDVDGDGSTEIVVTNSEATSGVYVVGEANNAWVGARFLWNQHAYNIVNVNGNLGIPSQPQLNWPTFNNFRQGAPGSMNPQGASDLVPIEGDVCQQWCGSDVFIVTQAANYGVLRAGPNTRISLYGEDAYGSRTILGASPFGVPLHPGATTDGRMFTVDVETLALYEKVFVHIDDTAVSNECDETDNEYEVDLSLICYEAEDTSTSDTSGDTSTGDTSTGDTSTGDTSTIDTATSDTVTHSGPIVSETYMLNFTSDSCGISLPPTER